MSLSLSTISIVCVFYCTIPANTDLFQSDSMVEIIRTPEKTPSPDLPDSSQHRLVYCKSKVYVNPTAYARDNIPGFVALVKQVCTLFKSVDLGAFLIPSPQESSASAYWLAWIPEALLNEKGSSEWEKFSKIERHPSFDDEDDGAS